MKQLQHFEENVVSSTDKLPSREEYICDMCMEIFTILTICSNTQ